MGIGPWRGRGGVLQRASGVDEKHGLKMLIQLLIFFKIFCHPFPWNLIFLSPSFCVPSFRTDKLSFCPEYQKYFALSKKEGSWAEM